MGTWAYTHNGDQPAGCEDDPNATLYIGTCDEGCVHLVIRDEGDGRHGCVETDGEQAEPVSGSIHLPTGQVPAAVWQLIAYSGADPDDVIAYIKAQTAQEDAEDIAAASAALAEMRLTGEPAVPLGTILEEMSEGPPGSLTSRMRVRRSPDFVAAFEREAEREFAPVLAEAQRELLADFEAALTGTGRTPHETFDEALERRNQAREEGAVEFSYCAHCGRSVGDYAGGWATLEGGVTVCHPNAPGRPDCYRLVTVYKETVGSRKPKIERGKHGVFHDHH